MSKYLLYFKIIILLGNSLGPLISYLSLVLLPVPLRRSNIFNAYTFPGWLCFFASIIILILIIFIYSEPLSPTFKIYAEGQDPSESMKRADSFALDENLTIFESEKLNEINERVSNFNDENQFNDTNLVSSTINELIDIEIEPYGTVRKAFWIIMSYIFILSFTFILYITMCPVFLYVNIYVQPSFPSRPCEWRKERRPASRSDRTRRTSSRILFRIQSSCHLRTGLSCKRTQEAP